MIIEIELIHVFVLMVPIILTVVGSAFYLGNKIGNLTAAIAGLIKQTGVQEKQIQTLYETKRNAKDCEPTHALLHKE